MHEGCFVSARLTPAQVVLYGQPFGSKRSHKTEKGLTKQRKVSQNRERSQKISKPETDVNNRGGYQKQRKVWTLDLSLFLCF